MDSYIPLSIPQIGGNEWQYVKDCLDTGWVSSAGSYVDKFEQDISNYTGARYAVAMVNGTAALHIALMLCGVEAGDEVIVPTLTFIAPVNVIKYLDANPVFMDCDDHLNIDTSKLAEYFGKECEFNGESLINKKTGARIKAIMVVHVFGHLADMKVVQDLADKYRLKVVEDATECLGSFYTDEKYRGKHAGTIGDIGCFSFNGNKIITTGGGGMLVTNSEDMAKKAYYYSKQAKDEPKRFIHGEIGYNYRLTNVLAAIGCAQLEQLDKFVEIKRKNFNIYSKHLNDFSGLRLLKEPEYCNSNYWKYTLVIDSSKYSMDTQALMAKLAEQKVESEMIWGLNHQQRPYRDCESYKIEKAEHYQQNCLKLPCSVNLKPSIIAEICSIIKR